MKAIEMETLISADGRLPSSFQEAFGRKVRVIVLFDEEKQKIIDKDVSVSLMELAGKITAFQDIEDPVDFQRKLRDEWRRDWEG